MAGHSDSGKMHAAAASSLPSPIPEARSSAAAPTFEDVYERHFDFVWRSVRRLGVPEGAVDDVVQDVFVIVHRKLPEFEGRSSIKTWLFGVVRRVVKDHRRSRSRRGGEHDPLRDSQVRTPDGDPMELAAKAEAVRVLHALLDELDDDKREAFVLAELEQMSVPEIADAIGVNTNTVYSRLRAARGAFEQAVARHRARDRWRQP